VARPDSAQRFHSLIGKTDQNAPLALAVSGGSDSMALMAWAHQHSKAANTKLHVLTVDHGLRPEARMETGFVLALAEALGHTAERLRWETPVSSQNAARDYRLRVLANAARRAGATTLLTGHTFDDVIETLLIRRRRNKTAPRLAGPALMAPCPVWPEGRGLTLFRPLLWQRRDALREALRCLAWKWFDDPSNDSDAYERGRVRAFLRRHTILARTVSEAAEAALNQRHVFDLALGAYLGDRKHVEIDPDGLIRVLALDPSHKVHLAALSTLIRIASGGDKQVSTLTARDAVTSLTSKGDRLTLGGAWLQRSDSGVLIGRDPGHVRRSVASGLWDGRFELRNDTQPVDSTHVLTRHAVPAGPGWHAVLSERLAFEASLLSQLTCETMSDWMAPISLEGDRLPTHLQRSEVPALDL